MITLLAHLLIASLLLLLIASLFLLLSGDAPEFDQPVRQELIDKVADKIRRELYLSTERYAELEIDIAEYDPDRLDRCIL